MDYEKKYDELMAKIEAVKRDPKIGLKDGDYYNGYVQKGIRSALDYLLQEESEDERVRKNILALVKKHAVNHERCQMEAYLEKQKELPFVKDVIRGLPWLYFYDGERMHFECSPAMEEKQKEQKPAEWSEEDERMRQDVIRFIETGWTDNGKSHLIPWLKSLRPQPHWKPRKEQINALQAFVGMIHPDARYNVVSSLLDELKAL